MMKRCEEGSILVEAIFSLVLVAIISEIILMSQMAMDKKIIRESDIEKKLQVLDEVFQEIELERMTAEDTTINMNGMGVQISLEDHDGLREILLETKDETYRNISLRKIIVYSNE